MLTQKKPITPSVFLLLSLSLIALRFLHFGPELDLPHDWRQADTAYYIYDFYKHGIKLLQPAVCWMGGHATLALEFPLPEAIVAQVWQVTGMSIPLARLIFLVFFVGAVYYLYRLVQLLYGCQLAQWTSLVYLALPLSLFYSRAIHIDFFALAFTHALVYYTLRAIRDQSIVYLLLSSLVAMVAFVVKVPYAFYFGLPLLAYAWQLGRLRWLLPRAVVFVLPLTAFWSWQQHTLVINGQAPDWDFILHYRKFVDNSAWYFGSLAQRFSLYNWKILSLRMLLEVAGLGSVIFVLFGASRVVKDKQYFFLWWWSLGLLGYLLIFFNLNKVHNYYQLPFLGISAILAAIGLTYLQKSKPTIAYWGFAILVLTNVAFAERQYYQVPFPLIEIGQHIQEHTPNNAIIISTYQDFDCKNPRLLYRSLRRGWSIEEKGVNLKLIQQLQAEGATHWAYVGERLPTSLEKYGAFAQKVDTISLAHSSEQLFLLELRKVN